jgi:hypothetical protein
MKHNFELIQTHIFSGGRKSIFFIFFQNLGLTFRIRCTIFEHDIGCIGFSFVADRCRIDLAEKQRSVFSQNGKNIKFRLDFSHPVYNLHTRYGPHRP